MSHWVYNGDVYNPEYEDIDHAGFIYLITNQLTGQQYIGRKRFHKKRTLKPLKGKKRRRIKITESDWPADYKGANQCMEQVEGWTNFLCCLKAYLEYGINLRVGAFIK